MAKVMISLPDSLLERIDAHVQAHRTSRSRFLREAAERGLALADEALAADIRKILATAAPHGGDNVRFIREMRRAR
ncbi:MAG TPA: ribbon-helix-helix protein, CopG family [Conexibacter sp.]|nr:ribbon-helix-helix protein, CopG family [Conexibacter sp.]